MLSFFVDDEDVAAAEADEVDGAKVSTEVDVESSEFRTNCKSDGPLITSPTAMYSPMAETSTGSE